MNLKILIFVSIITFGLYAKDQSCKHDRNNFRCVKYVKNYDADTISFNIPNVHPLIGENISVRVLGVDTPEIRTKNVCEKKKAIEARDFVAKLLEAAKRIDLENIGKDKYFRIISSVIVDGVPLSKLLLNNKFAYSYDGGTKQKIDWCTFNQRKPALIK
jgi:micrococcal nuclease